MSGDSLRPQRPAGSSMIRGESYLVPLFEVVTMMQNSHVAFIPAFVQTSFRSGPPACHRGDAVLSLVLKS